MKLIPHKFIDGVEYKRCSTCKEYHTLDAFYTSKKNWDGLKRECKLAEKNYRMKNAEKRSAYSKRWRKENPERFKASRNKRYHTNSKARLGQLLRNRLNMALKAGGIRKTTSTMKLCGCSLEKLKQHIEDQFYDGMSWEKKNFHIDHMEPCALFNLADEEEQRKCFHYTNLKPEWPSKNMSDGGKRKWNMEWNGERWIVHGRL